jgi:hypothetical protein
MPKSNKGKGGRRYMSYVRLFIMKNKFISKDNCKIGTVYRLESRNLRVGVFAASNTFIGIRQKFDSQFLDSELHWDCGATAVAIEELGVIPEEIELKESLGSFDMVTGLEVKFDKPIVNGGKGWYFVATGVASQQIRPYIKPNAPLFEYLMTYASTDTCA